MYLRIFTLAIDHQADLSPIAIINSDCNELICMLKPSAINWFEVVTYDGMDTTKELTCLPMIAFTSAALGDAPCGKLNPL